MSTEPSTSTSFVSYGLPEDVPHIPGVTEPQLCILDSFRTAISRKIVDVWPELMIEKVCYLSCDSRESLIFYH